LVSKKGIALTAGIAAGVIAASFLVWFLPQNNSGVAGSTAVSTYNTILSDIYSQHTALVSNVTSQFDKWKNGTLSSDDMNATISSAKTQVQSLLQRIANANPPPEWQQSYDSYAKSLQIFSSYLDAMQKRVQLNDKTGSDSELNALKSQSDNYIDQAVSKWPTS
jgi:hypothetical protein